MLLLRTSPLIGVIHEREAIIFFLEEAVVASATLPHPCTSDPVFYQYTTPLSSQTRSKR